MKTKKNILQKCNEKTIRLNKIIYAIIFTVGLFQSGTILSQNQTYGIFEGYRSLYFSSKSGILDTAAKNPAMGKVYNKETCAKYVRSAGDKYDNIKLTFMSKLADVNKYASYTANAPMITMKVYTTAPVGTLIQVQLAKSGKNDYPAGVYAEFQARTTTTNNWEVVKFKFAQMPKGSEVNSTQVDQMNILFNPNTSTKDTYYFADITGPSLVADKPKLSATPANSNVVK